MSEPASEDVVLVERDGDIATVTLNRSEKRNALNKPLWIGVGRALRELSADDDLRCVVLRGSGGHFSPGADIAEFATTRANSDQAAEYGKIMHDTMAAIRDCRHPTVVLIEGNCIGGGLELAMMADIRLCGESSTFGVPIQRIGVIMAYPEIAALITLVGRAAALEILLEGRVFGALEAKEKGLVTRVVPDHEVADAAYKSARRIADGAPLTHRLHKQFANRLLDPKPITSAEIRGCYVTFDSEDYHSAFRAFLDKKKPTFKGK